MKKRDSVLQGHGGEQNNAGEVGWSGSGSPYPKNASQEGIFEPDQDEVSEEHKTHNTVVPAKGKETKIVTPDGQIYYIEFPEDDTHPLGGKQGKTGNPTVSEKSQPGAKDVEVEEETEEDKKFHKMLHKLNQSRNKKKKLKKATITHVHSRLKNIQTRIGISDFLLRKTEEFGGMNTGEVEPTEPRDTANSREQSSSNTANQKQQSNLKQQINLKQQLNQKQRVNLKEQINQKQRDQNVT